MCMLPKTEIYILQHRHTPLRREIDRLLAVTGANQCVVSHTLCGKKRTTPHSVRRDIRPAEMPILCQQAKASTLGRWAFLSTGNSSVQNGAGRAHDTPLLHPAGTVDLYVWSNTGMSPSSYHLATNPLGDKWREHWRTLVSPPRTLPPVSPC